MPSTYKKDKPWDTEDIDKWKIDKFTSEDNPAGSFTTTSDFKTLFPKYREVYLKTTWPLVTASLRKHHISATLNLVEGSMSVATTRKTFDPAAILKARDVIKLLARSVPAPQAVKVMDEDGWAVDVVKIRGLVRNKERFARRRQRLLGPNGTTLKALELLTGCYVLVQGGTVSAMGPFKGLKEVRRVVEDCMRNVHPVYHVKELMIKRELAKDPELVNEDWSRFLPNFKRRTLSKRKKPLKVSDKSKKPYTPFPPPREMSKVDLQMESGEYFLGKQAKERREREAREERQREKIAEKKKARLKDFEPPKEDGVGEAKKKKKKRKIEEEGGNVGGSAEDADAAEKRKHKKRRKETDLVNGDADLDPSPPKPKKRREKSADAASSSDDTAAKQEKKERKRKRREAKALANGVDVDGGPENGANEARESKKRKKGKKRAFDAESEEGGIAL